MAGLPSTQRVTVFLSGEQASTERRTKGLQRERDAVAKLFDDDPILSRLFALTRIEDRSAPTSVAARYASDVAHHQALLLFVGADVRPAVHQEFLLAKQHGKQIFAFVKDTSARQRSVEYTGFLEDIRANATYCTFRGADDLCNKVRRNFVAWLLDTTQAHLRQESTWVADRLTRVPVPKRISIDLSDFRRSKSGEAMADGCLRYNWSLSITYEVDTTYKYAHEVKVILVSYPAGLEDKGMAAVHSITDSDDDFAFLACPLLPANPVIHDCTRALRDIGIHVDSLKSNGAVSSTEALANAEIAQHDGQGILSLVYRAKAKLSRSVPTVRVRYTDVPHSMARGYMVFNAGDVATEALQLRVRSNLSLRGRVTPIVHEKQWTLEDSSSSIIANRPHIIVPTEGFVVEVPTPQDLL